MDIKNSITYTKLNKPTIDVDHIYRNRIIDILEKNSSKPMTLVSAGAGYGKSMLISSWLEKNKKTKKYAWISLNDTENEMNHFLSYIYEALNRINPGHFINIYNLTQAINNPRVIDIATTIINDIDGQSENITLVLDDYYFIYNEEIHELINNILQYPPENLHLVIISRSDPPIRISNLRAQGRLNDIRMNDLLFDNKEAESLFNKYQLNQDYFTKILDRTEGWIAGLKIISFSFQNNNTKSEDILNKFSANYQWISDYLMDEIFNNLSDETQNELLTCSLFSRFNSELIDEVNSSFTNSKKLSGNEIIELLKKDNLFIISLDDYNYWFRFHHLFEELLKDVANTKFSKSEKQKIYSRAAEWHQENKFLKEALNLYFLADEPRRCKELIKKEGFNIISKLGIIETKKWIEKLPQNIINSSPEILIIKGWIAYGSLQLHELSEITSVLETLFSSKKSNELLKLELDFFKGNLHYWMGKTEESLDLILPVLKTKNKLPKHIIGDAEFIISLIKQRLGEEKEYDKVLNEKIEAYKINRPEIIPYLYASKSFLFYLSGKLNESKNEAFLIKTAASKLDDLYLEAWSNYFLACTNFDIFHINEVIEYCDKTLQLQYSFDNAAVLQILALKSLNYYFLNEQDLAKKTLKSLKDYLSQIEYADSQNIIESLNARINLLNGNHKEALKWAESFHDPLAFENIFLWIEIPWFTQIKSFLQTQEPFYVKKAFEILTELETIIIKNNLCIHYVELNLLFALVCLIDDKKEKAALHINKAVNNGIENNQMRPFFELYRISPIIKKELFALIKNDEFKNKLSNLFGEQLHALQDSKEATLLSSGSNFTDTIFSQLTPRELETVQYLSKGLRNKEISEKMFISVDAVKKHLYRIFQKLNISNRLELINLSKKFLLVDNHNSNL